MAPSDGAEAVPLALQEADSTTGSGTGGDSPAPEGERKAVPEGVERASRASSEEVSWERISYAVRQSLKFLDRLGLKLVHVLVQVAEGSHQELRLSSQVDLTNVVPSSETKGKQSKSTAAAATNEQPAAAETKPAEPAQPGQFHVTGVCVLMLFVVLETKHRIQWLV